MKKWLFIIVVLVVFVVSTCDKFPVEGEVHVCTPDTIVITNDIIVIDNRRIDSLNTIIDSLNAELFVANYKIERIKYYNDIAKKESNLKFLRGWINRVLND